MYSLSFVVIVMLLLLTLTLAVKVCLLRRAAVELARAFHDRLTTDTNTLIDISSRDPAMRTLAAEINVELRRLRVEHNRFKQGDMELKEAVTNISHDLRTPLTAIGGYLDLLEREETSDNVKRYVAQIRNRTKALCTLTEELLVYSIVTSEHSLNFEELDLVRALEESLVSFYAVMRERGIEPQIDLPEDPVCVLLDPGAVNRIFSNIIGNAVKYSSGDLSVTMEYSGEIVFENGAPELDRVSVGRMFDRFYTVNAGRSQTGLGLSIAKQLTERMGGTIDAELNGDRLRIRLMLAKRVPQTFHNNKQP